MLPQNVNRFLIPGARKHHRDRKWNPRLDHLDHRLIHGVTHANVIAPHKY
jgi:hypothetical protein